MDQGRIAVRYAKALYSLGKENNLTEVFKKDLHYVQSIMNHSDQLVFLLECPVVKISDKNKILKKLFENQVHAHVLSFLTLLVSHRRESVLKGVFRNFFDIYRKENNIVSSTLTTAGMVDETTKDKIKAIIKNAFHSDVELLTKQNPDLLGGYVLRIDDKQVDYSVSGQLKKVYNTLIAANK